MTQATPKILTLCFCMMATPASAQVQEFFEDLFGIPPRPLPPYNRPRTDYPPRGENPYVPEQPSIPDTLDRPAEMIEPYSVRPVIPAEISPGVGPYTGRWSSWENDRIVGGSEIFSDRRACFNGLSALVTKYNHQVEITCNDSNDRVTLYFSCQPANGKAECFDKGLRFPK